MWHNGSETAPYIQWEKATWGTGGQGINNMTEGRTIFFCPFLQFLFWTTLTIITMIISMTLTCTPGMWWAMACVQAFPGSHPQPAAGQWLRGPPSVHAIQKRSASSSLPPEEREQITVRHCFSSILSKGALYHLFHLRKKSRSRWGIAVHATQKMSVSSSFPPEKKEQITMRHCCARHSEKEPLIISSTWEKRADHFEALLCTPLRKGALHHLFHLRKESRSQWGIAFHSCWENEVCLHLFHLRKEQGQEHFGYGSPP